MKTILLRGVRLADTTMDGALAFLQTRLRTGQQTAVFTPNTEILQDAVTDEDFRALLNRAELPVADGAGVVQAARILGTPLPEKIAGVELGLRLLEDSAGRAVFLLGGRPGVAEEAAARLRERIDGLHITGTADGYFQKSGAENNAILQKIRNAGTEILFVCFGSPAQERWIDENRARLPGVLVLLGLGGSLDVYAGRERRAPGLFIRLQLEWLWRLCRHPGRLARMRKIPRFLRETRRLKRQQEKMNRDSR